VIPVARIVGLDFELGIQFAINDATTIDFESTWEGNPNCSRIEVT